MKFIGIDFGWASGASGLCCLSWHEKNLQLLDITTMLEINSILDWIDNWISPDEPGIIAIDAPTIINNQTGMRLAEKLTHKHFGRYHAGCYPANLNSSFCNRTTGFSLSLAKKNFSHAPKIIPKQLGRYQIEVFPHPATINLFGLDKILKYKKGKIAERQQELNKLQRHITQVLSSLEPMLASANVKKIPIVMGNKTGKELKNIEDQLDSLLCAYIAAHWWYWGLVNQKNLVLGNLEEGFIVIPNP